MYGDMLDAQHTLPIITVPAFKYFVTNSKI